MVHVTFPGNRINFCMEAAKEGRYFELGVVWQMLVTKNMALGIRKQFFNVGMHMDAAQRRRIVAV